MTTATGARVGGTAHASYQQRRSFTIPIGCVLVLIGVMMSGPLLEGTVLAPGTIVGTTRRAAALTVARLSLALLGLVLLLRRPRLTIVHVTAFGFATLVSMLVGAVLLQLAYTPPPLMCGWRSFAPASEQNELGYRGRQIAYSSDDFVVVLLGDSQVEAMALPLDGMPERLLERHLTVPNRRVRVFTLGSGGYGQDQELLALQQYFQKYRADLVVLWQTPGNDVWNNMFKTHMFNRNPKPTYWLDATHALQGPSEGLGQPLGDSRIVVAAMWQRALGLPRRDLSWEQGLPKAYVPMESYSGPVNREWQDRWNTDLGRMRDENLATEKSHFAVMLAPRSARMQYGLDLTRALTERIRETVAGQHGRLVLFQAETEKSVPKGNEVFVLNEKYYKVSRDQFYENWNYINRGFDAELVQITTKDWRVAGDDGHLNAAATEQAMSLLADRLSAMLLTNTH